MLHLHSNVDLFLKASYEKKTFLGPVRQSSSICGFSNFGLSFENEPIISRKCEKPSLMMHQVSPSKFPENATECKIVLNQPKQNSNSAFPVSIFTVLNLCSNHCSN